MNLGIFNFINGLAHKNLYVDSMMIFFSKYVPYIFIVIVGAIFIQGIIKKDRNLRKTAVNTVIITLINLMLGYIIGLLYYVDRPFVKHKVNLLFPHVRDASFPSDHALGTMSISLGLGKYNKTLGVFMAIVSFMVGFSRIYVGHHYPVDIIGAYTIVIIVNYIYNNKLRSKTDKLYDKIEERMIGKLSSWKKNNNTNDSL